jgi:hypothetical protein
MKAQHKDHAHEKSAFFIRLNHSQTVFFSNVAIAGRSCAADFKKIAADVFLMTLHAPVPCHFLDQVAFKKNQLPGTVLLPAGLAQTNRQHKRIAAMLDDFESESPAMRFEKLVTAERFLRLAGLQSFFAMPAAQLEEILWPLAATGKVHVLELLSFAVAAGDYIQNCRDEFRTYIKSAHEKRESSIPLADLAKLIGPLNQVSTAVRYLVRSLGQGVPDYVLDHHTTLVFMKLPLPDEDIGRIEQVERAIRTLKMPAFTIEQAIAASGLSEKQVNDALWYLLDDGRITRLSNSEFMFSDDLTKVINRLKKYKRNQGDMIDIQTMRELTALNRKTIILLFEYFDTQKITEFQQNKRKILLTV